MSSYAERRRAVLERVEGADALIVTAPVNVRYLTGFTGSNGQLLLGSEPLFFTDGRYTEQSADQVPDVARRIYSGVGLAGELADVVSDRGIGKLGFEAAHVTVDGRRRLGEKLEGTDLVPTTDVVEGVRARKDPAEVDAIRRAQRLSERVLWDVLTRWSGGTERELALELEWAIRTGGGEAVSFDVIVASGGHAALPHAMPRDVEIPSDGVLLVDMGAIVDGYCSDMTRTFLRDASDPLPAAHEAVVAALEAACAAVGPGVECSEVDRAARELLEGEGYGDAFVHTTGHGVGLDIHEGPRLSKESEEVLEPGMVVTVEPGVYLAGVGGIRVEDMLVVTEDGSENLTEVPRGPQWPTRT